MSSPSSPHFPRARWGDYRVSFQPLVEPSDQAACWAVVVFAMCGDCFLLADIPDRGWVVPSGHIEPHEAPLEAAIREAREEVGGELEDVIELGRYTLVDSEGNPTYAAAYAGWMRSFGAIPEGSESLGTCCVPRPLLRQTYYMWDDLLERVFEYAEQELIRHSPGSRA